MATVKKPGPFATKPLDQLRETAEGTRLHRAVGAQRGFRVPFVPVLPLIGAALCIYLMTRLPVETWLRFVVWMAIGFALYFAYGYTHSELRKRHEAEAAKR